MRLAEFLERPAGEVVIGFGLMLFGCLMWYLKIPKNDDVLIAGSTLISRGIIGQVKSKPSDSQQ